MAPKIAESTTTRNNSGQFGNLVWLRPTNNSSRKTTKKTRVVKITEETWEKLKVFSHKYHDQPITYDEIIEELVDFYNNNKHNEQKWF